MMMMKMLMSGTDTSEINRSVMYRSVRYKKTAIARGHSASNGIIGVEFHEMHDDDEDDYERNRHS